MNSRLRVFLEEPGFMKLFSLFSEKYRSLGRVGGFVSLKGFKEAEIDAIAGFLGLSAATLTEKGRVGLVQFENELAKTGYSEVTLVELLEEVFQEPLLSKKEELENALKLEKDFVESLRLKIPEAGWWLDWLMEKSPDTRWIWTLYKQNELLLLEMINNVTKAFLTLPAKGEFERLPFFAQRTIGNPHFFDVSESGGRLLVHILAVYKKTFQEHEFLFPKSTEEINDLLAEFGLLRDDLWNFVTVQGLIASSPAGVHPVWQAAVQTQTVLNVPMKELAKVDKIIPASGRKVWVVENSSVASTVMDAVPDAPIICTHGQLRTASWRLLDQLAEAGYTLFYSGDLDPEGILIADRLKIRYHEKLILWQMDADAYEKSMSEEDISERVLKLNGVNPTIWNEIIELIRDKKKAGYQEALVDLLISDIRNAQERD
ncbi:TIGR02679 family protein [Bacillus sp. ISL-39]|uniref:TIGR02679 family protein n=1 Tax=Bacillus sp. ISL-39 TaxID=2819124 RepID=UPI001BE82907|nr:TIGR02679 family protein [Bacillus sp. ISL-39]MBT2640599.1 TIGR02679 family protein [Bacillus sp. ISL-39]